MTIDQELEGTALRIYVALVNEDKPLGPREITRLANLSSPSVAYRNLQKLEESGLIEKDSFGEYTVKMRQGKGTLLGRQQIVPEADVLRFLFCGHFKCRSCYRCY